MPEAGGLHFKKKDAKVFRACKQYRKGMFTPWQAAQKISLSTRSLSQKLKSVREKGLEGLVHGNKGRAPKNKHSEELKAWYVDLYKETYFDFNFLHA